MAAGKIDRDGLTLSAEEEKGADALDRLLDGVGVYRNSKQLKELFEFIRKFPCIGPFNAFLVHLQKPGSRFVATANEWEEKYGRTIKPGSRPLLVLKPFWPVDFIYELGDTEGEPFPEELLRPFKVDGCVTPKVFNRLQKNLLCYGIEYVEADLGTSMAGSIENVSSQGRTLPFRQNKKVKIQYLLKVNRTLTQSDKFAIIVHELAHLFCGHLGAVLDTWRPDRSKLNHEEKEFEAECIAYFVCGRLGIETHSEEYLYDCLADDKVIPKIHLHLVFSVAGIVENMMIKSTPIRREVLLGKPPLPAYRKRKRTRSQLMDRLSNRVR